MATEISLLGEGPYKDVAGRTFKAYVKKRSPSKTFGINDGENVDTAKPRLEGKLVELRATPQLAPAAAAKDGDGSRKRSRAATADAGVSSEYAEA